MCRYIYPVAYKVKFELQKKKTRIKILTFICTNMNVHNILDAIYSYIYIYVCMENSPISRIVVMVVG